MNAYFTENKSQLHGLMIFSSLLMDIIVGCLFTYFLCAKQISVWRIPLEFALFYGIRFFCLTIFAIETPAGFYWEYPGFPSLTVPYGWTNDFFYSGHSGACVLCLCEFKSMGKRVDGLWRKCCFSLQTLSVLSLGFQVFLMLVTRGHYSIDLISGAVFAHYCHLLALRCFPERTAEPSTGQTAAVV